MQVIDERRFRPDKKPDNVRRYKFDSEEIRVSVVSNGDKTVYEPEEVDEALKHYLRLRAEGERARLTISTVHEVVNCTTAFDNGELVHDVIRAIKPR